MPYCVIGAFASAMDLSFAEGYTGSDFQEWPHLHNPGNGQRFQVRMRITLARYISTVKATSIRLETTVPKYAWKPNPP
jgi:hypothetical protein